LSSIFLYHPSRGHALALFDLSHRSVWYFFSVWRSGVPVVVLPDIFFSVQGFRLFSMRCNVPAVRTLSLPTSALPTLLREKPRLNFYHLRRAPPPEISFFRPGLLNRAPFHAASRFLCPRRHNSFLGGSAYPIPMPVPASPSRVPYRVPAPSRSFVSRFSPSAAEMFIVEHPCII